MQATDFAVFRTLLSDIHVKVFGEPISKLTHSKAQMLSWLIFEATGELLSYKSLINYFAATLDGAQALVNPNLTTLVILAEFATGQPHDEQPPLIRWWKFRSQVLCSRADA